MGFLSSGLNSSRLTLAELDLLCSNLEEKFRIEKKTIQHNQVIYQINRVNSMRWVDHGIITIQRDINNVQVGYSISCLSMMIMMFVFSIISLVFQVLNDSIIFGIIIFLIFNIFSLMLSLLAFQVFQIRVNKSINEILTGRNNLSEEQSRWLNDSTRCPACGHVVGLNHAVCQDCGLNLKA